jgi:quercetin dioxygenase-like cupin family protein
MKIFQNTEDGVLAGKGNNTDLFIRKVTFESGYAESDFHHHPNSFEFYIVLEGSLIFANEELELEAQSGSIVYFEQSEKHKIVTVKQDSELLLLKRIDSLKV